MEWLKEHKYWVIGGLGVGVGLLYLVTRPRPMTPEEQAAHLEAARAGTTTLLPGFRYDPTAIRGNKPE